MPRLALTRTRGLLAAGGVLLAAAAAQAATPANGEVSKAAPKITWTGSVTNSYFNRVPVVVTGDDTVPCLPQTCDSFALKVAESDDLTLTADAPESTSQTGGAGSQVTLRVRKPDGSVEVFTTGTEGATPEKPLTVKIKKAAAGAYTIEYFNYFYGTPVDYTGTATLGPVAKPGAPAAPSPATPSSPTTAPPSSQPAAKEDIGLTVKAGKASAKKLAKAKKLAATVTVSREVQSIVATLKSGKKVVGKGKLGKTSGTAKVALKLSKKLKKGKYALTVVASDGAGVSATKTIAVKVAK